MGIGAASVSCGMGGISMQILFKYSFQVDKKIINKLIFQLDVQLLKLWDSCSF